MTTYFPLILSWLVFGFIHSLTAAHWFKEWVFGYTAKQKSYFRLLYNGVALITFLPVLFALRLAPIELVTEWYGSPWLGTIVMGTGSLLVLLALKTYDLAEFLGWPPSHQSTAIGTLRQTGVLSYVRHPLYAGTILLLLGLTIYQPDWKHLLFCLGAFLYIRIGIYFEERKLIRNFGDHYRAYRRQVPMLVPRFFVR